LGRVQGSDQQRLAFAWAWAADCRRVSLVDGIGLVNMRGIQVVLPPSAAARHAELALARDSAMDAARSAQQRLNDLPGDVDQLLRDRLAAQVSLQTQRNSQLHRLLSSVNQFLFSLRLRPGEVLAPVTVPVTLAKGETAAQAVGKLRVEMLQLQQELARVRHAPLPISDQIGAAERYVAQRGAVAGPRVGVVRDQLQLQWPDDVIGSKQDLIGVLCWLAPTSVVAALKREIEAGPAPVNPMSAAVRDAKIVELSAKLLELERCEAALLDDTILPRHDMNPLAYLQVEIRTEARAQQVA
jgi:hypothetical protein